jgi:hypothetical protein
MKHRRLFVLAIVFLSTFYPARAYACGSFLCIGDMLGITDMANRDAQRREHQAEIDRQKAQEVARINADAQARIAEANRQLEAQRIQGQISATQAKAMADAFAAAVNAKRDEYVAALQANAQVAINGINETGATERERVGWQAKTDMLTIGIIGVLILAALGAGAWLLTRHIDRKPQQITVMLAGHIAGQLDQPSTMYLPRHQHMIDGGTTKLISGENDR